MSETETVDPQRIAEIEREVARLTGKQLNDTPPPPPAQTQRSRQLEFAHNRAREARIRAAEEQAKLDAPALAKRTAAMGALDQQLRQEDARHAAAVEAENARWQKATAQLMTERQRAHLKFPDPAQAREVARLQEQASAREASSAPSRGGFVRVGR